MTEPEHVPNNARMEPGALVFLDEEPYATGFTDEQIEYLLRGGDDATALEAAGTPQAEHTGAMVALIPSAADVARLELAGYELAEQLHVTALYLGEASDFDMDVRDDIIEATAAYASDVEQFEAQAFGVALLNPVGEEPCLVLNVGGADLAQVLADLRIIVDDAGVSYAEQHQPMLAHLTLAYTDDPRLLLTDDLYSRLGPMTIDRVRVAFGDQVTDLYLDSDVTSRYTEPGPATTGEVYVLHDADD